MDWIPALPDGKAVTGIQVPGSVIVLAEMLIYIKHLAVIYRR